MGKAIRAAGQNSGSSSQSRIFVAEDILINIFLRLPTASCIARFRCVCRSWRILLSDPKFIHSFLSFQNPDDLKSLQILITGRPDFPSTTPAHYSLHSFDTLGLISAGELPPVPTKDLPIVLGCCNGIFCIADENRGGPSDLLLWNPATSETKLILPPTTCPRYRRGIEVSEELIGFGYDPVTNDYKLVRILRLELANNDPEIDFVAAVRKFPHPIPFTYAEVYSSRNDSWKKLSVSRDLATHGRGLECVNQQREVSLNQKCYWFGAWLKHSCFLSFDMSREVFEHTLSDHPSALAGWICEHWFMSRKESFVATFYSAHSYDLPYQIWGLLKHGAACSWTKLLTIAPLGCPLAGPLEVWKEGAYICSKGSSSSSPDHLYISPLSWEKKKKKKKKKMVVALSRSEVVQPARSKLSVILQLRYRLLPCCWEKVNYESDIATRRARMYAARSLN